VADCYAGGTSEVALGNFLERMKKREQVWITTKSDAWDPNGLLDTLDTSLRRLKTDHVDLYFLHELSRENALTSELARTVEQLKKEVKIKFFGFSTHSANVFDLLNKAAGLSWIDAIMF